MGPTLRPRKKPDTRAGLGLETSEKARFSKATHPNALAAVKRELLAKQQALRAEKASLRAKNQLLKAQQQAFRAELKDFNAQKKELEAQQKELRVQTKSLEAKQAEFANNHHNSHAVAAHAILSLSSQTTNSVQEHAKKNLEKLPNAKRKDYLECPRDNTPLPVVFEQIKWLQDATGQGVDITDISVRVGKRILNDARLVYNSQDRMCTQVYGRSNKVPVKFNGKLIGRRGLLDDVIPDDLVTVSADNITVIGGKGEFVPEGPIIL
jgi:DNA repair exonuclease SbcCD ATPase subunit